MANILPFRTVTSTPSAILDVNDCFVDVNRASNITAIVTLPDLNTVTSGQFYVIHVRDEYSAQVEIQTFNSSQRIVGSELSIRIRCFETVILYKVTNTYWAMK